MFLLLTIKLLILTMSNVIHVRSVARKLEQHFVRVNLDKDVSWTCDVLTIFGNPAVKPDVSSLSVNKRPPALISHSGILRTNYINRLTNPPTQASSDS